MAGAGEDDQFVLRRQHSLQRWLRTILKHHALTKDPDIQTFLTQDHIPPATRFVFSTFYLTCYIPCLVPEQ